MVLLGFKCFSSPGRAKLWCCLGLIVSVPQGGVLLGFVVGGRGCCLGLNVSVPQGRRGCGVAWV